MNSNTGMSLLICQEVIKKDFDEKKNIRGVWEYKEFITISKNDKPFKEMSLKDYKKNKWKIDKLDKKKLLI